jgi:hypothetical protein
LCNILNEEIRYISDIYMLGFNSGVILILKTQKLDYVQIS